MSAWPFSPKVYEKTYMSYQLSLQYEGVHSSNTSVQIVHQSCHICRTCSPRYEYECGSSGNVCVQTRHHICHIYMVSLQYDCESATSAKLLMKLFTTTATSIQHLFSISARLQQNLREYLTPCTHICQVSP